MAEAGGASAAGGRRGKRGKWTEEFKSKVLGVLQVRRGPGSKVLGMLQVKRAWAWPAVPRRMYCI